MDICQVAKPQGKYPPLDNLKPGFNGGKNGRAKFKTNCAMEQVP